jgi:uncharacterized protein (TIGR03084 family)
VAVDLEALLADVAAESAELSRMLADADPDAGSMPTPAAGWTVADQIGHLWFFDREARRALQDPDGFVAGLASIAADLEGYLARHLDAGRALGDDLPAAFGAERSQLLAALRAADPSSRVPWYGPPMSPASFATARLMETWAHGEDIADGLGVRRTPTDRLRHVCHLGVRTRGFSYAVRGETPPGAPVGVVVTAPSGEVWSWGDAKAADRIEGAAVDFALVVTQRRHLADVDLRVTGASAADWMAKAQAFAGAPTVTDAARHGLDVG